MDTVIAERIVRLCDDVLDALICQQSYLEADDVNGAKSVLSVIRGGVYLLREMPHLVSMTDADWDYWMGALCAH